MYLRDLRAGKTQQVDVSTAGAHADEISGGPSISDNGRRVAFVSLAHNLVPGDSNEAWDVFVRDLRRGTTERASVAANGEEADLQSLSSWLSPSGRLVAFSSQATNLLPADTNTTEDVFVRHLQP